MANCYCGSGVDFSDCCEPLIFFKKPAENCEQLMRSRYSAYATKNAKYIVETYAEKTKKQQTEADILSWAKQTKWLKLTIVEHSETESLGYVEFIAKFLHSGKRDQLHEKSRFIKENNCWRYLDGVIFE